MLTKEESKEGGGWGGGAEDKHMPEDRLPIFESGTPAGVKGFYYYFE